VWVECAVDVDLVSDRCRWNAQSMSISYPIGSEAQLMGRACVRECWIRSGSDSRADDGINDPANG